MRAKDFEPYTETTRHIVTRNLAYYKIIIISIIIMIVIIIIIISPHAAYLRGGLLLVTKSPKPIVLSEMNEK